MRALVAAPLFVALFSAHVEAQLFGSPTLTIVADPATATIYKVKAQDNSLVQLGVGNAKLKLEKDDANTIVVRQEGFRDVKRSFPRDAEYKDKMFTVVLTKRVVQLTTLPYDARILVNGEFKGTRQFEVEVEQGQATTVELKKPSYATIKRIYRWDKGGELPPVQDRWELVDRSVSVTSAPERVELVSDDQKIGDGDADFIIKRGTCAKLTARKTGYISDTHEYCNKEGQPEPPPTDRFVLTGRVVKVTAPEEARIYVNDKAVASGAYSVNIAINNCATVKVAQPGFLSFVQEYCNKQNEEPPPISENVTLRTDGSYQASTASDQANVNVTIEVNKNLKEEQAWKLLSSIVLTYFDILENSDSQTGYLRTAWQIKAWGVTAPNESVVRTRVILKRISDLPLRYSLKIVSEKNKDGLRRDWSTKDDENYQPWDRILTMYKEVINEAQTRLK